MVAIPETPFVRKDLGVNRGVFFRMVSDGRIREVLRGVYVSGRVEDSLDLRLAAAGKALLPGQVLVDRSAAWVHGTDAFAWGEHDVLPNTEVCAVHGTEPVRRPGISGGRRDLAKSDVTMIAGVPVTTPLRTAADLGCRLRRREAYAAMCDLSGRHGFSAGDLQAYVEAFKGRRGVIQFRELAPLVAGQFESAREAWVWLAIHDAGLPEPELQVPARGRSGADYRLDLAYPRLRIAIEYDGEEFHDHVDGRRRDHRRRRDLVGGGWTFVVVRRGDFKAASLDRWLNELRRLIAVSYVPTRW